MTVNKRKKFSRGRGGMTYGKGSKKKRRGSGNRGGKGMAGSGKRSDSKKPTISKIENYFGKHGFVSKSTNDIKGINIGYIDENLSKLTERNLALKESGFISIDLKKLGFDKLLSKGKVSNKYKIKASYASEKAIEKVNGGGGEVVLEE